MIEHGSFNQFAAAVHGWLKIKQPFSFGAYWGAKRMGCAMMTSLAIALRGGLLVTTCAVATAAYLLLANSHI